jgi:CubicO group peptidase (beta-lactamase class C family)
MRLLVFIVFLTGFILLNFNQFQVGIALAAESNDFIGKGEFSGPYWPTDEWKTCRPEAVGMNSEKLRQAIEYAATSSFNTEGLIVIRRGYVVGEAYFGKFKIDSLHVSHSMAKSFTSTLIGIAIDKGLIKGIDEKLCLYYPEWKCDDQKDYRSRITIRHALTLTTGLEWQENWARMDPGTNDAIKMGMSGQFIHYMAGRRGLYEPGERFVYSTGDPMLLSRVLQNATGKTAFEFAQQNLFQPLNINNVRWEKDKEGYTATAWGLQATVRNFAKFGYLIQNKGVWDDKQVVSKGWLEKATQTDSSVRMWNAYGYLWHVNLPLRLRDFSGILPKDGFMAEGILGQNIVIIPSRDLVIVRVANQIKENMDLVKFLTLIITAIEK